MRDIRNDLRERLAAARDRLTDEMARYQEEAERIAQEHKNRRESIEQEIDAVRTMIAFEDERHGEVVTVLPPRLRLPLADFLVEAVRAHGALSKDDLRARASQAGYLDEATGRTLHFTLLNIVKAGRLRAWPDNFFDMPQHGPQFVTDEEDKPMAAQ